MTRSQRDKREAGQFAVAIPLLSRVDGVRMARFEAGDHGYSAVFSSYVLFRIEKGVVTAERELDKRAYNRFRRDQFTLFKKTSAYQSLVAQSGNTLKPDQLEQFIFLFAVEEYTSTIFEQR